MSKRYLFLSLILAALLAGLLAYNARGSLLPMASGQVRVACDPALLGPVSSAAREYGREYRARVAVTAAADPFGVTSVLPGADLAVGWSGAALEAARAAGRAQEALPLASDPAKGMAEAAVSASSPDPTSTLRFARYLAARDRGLPAFAAAGFRPVEGDKWEAVPEIQLYAGAMLRPAIDSAINAFERREGVRITRIYNGCGILVSQMRGGQRPDAYFACDVSFMTKVQDLFLPSVDVSRNPMVLLVAKGNPKGIRDARDLLRPGVRVGLGHPEKAALGALTKLMFEKMDLYAPLKASGNVRVESATGDFLVNQLRVGSLDAVVVYVSNASQVHAFLDVIPIADPAALATQPYAIGKASNHRHLMERFLERVQGTESQQRFTGLGFQWIGQGGAERVAGK